MAAPIGLAAGLLEDEGGGVVFLHGMATYQWSAGDEVSRRLAALQLHQLQVASADEIGSAFGTDRSTLFRWRERYQTSGAMGLAAEKRGPKGPSKLGPQVVEQIRGLKAEGCSGREIGRRLGLDASTVGRALHLARERQVPARLVPEATEALPAVPPPEVRREERQAARRGEIVEAAPVFTAGRELPLLGLLLALPALAETGLLEAAEEVYGKLRNGFYGLRSTLLMLVFLALLREPRAEGASRLGPADLGRVLGLDRAPEVKTIRRKLGELVSWEKASDLLAELARRHAQARPEALGYLYLDGHVRVYSGKRDLPKAHVTRLRISAPASEEVWVSDQDGDPVLVVPQEPGSSLVKQLRALLPELKDLLGGRRLTICFDRGGWSPELFYDIVMAGFDFITYRKGRGRREPARAFKEVEQVVEGATHNYLLADRRIRLRLPKSAGRPKTLSLRQVVRKVDDHQTVIVTSRRDLSPGEVAFRMFSRWRQENYFRYGRAHFALDALDSYAVVEDDPQRLIANPERKQRERQRNQARAQLAKLQAALGQSNLELAPPAEVDKIRLDLDVAQAEVEYLQGQIDLMPARVPLAQVSPQARLSDPEPKLITHAVRLSAYNAESALTRLLAPFYARARDEGRALLREAFKLSGDLCVVDGHLDVRLNPLSAPRRTHALAQLCQLLTDSQTIYPGTDLVVHYSVKEAPRVA
ncbi:MAG: putative transposase [Candidatus Dormibacteria bacterium]